MTNASRTVLERREYEPYGSQLTPAVSNGPGYTGHVQDAATGLVYIQQRFLSVDPVAAREKGDNFNRYAYAFNNPYRFTDPSGTEGVGARWLAQNKAFSKATASMPGSNAPALAFAGVTLLTPIVGLAVEAAGPALAVGLNVPAAVATGEGGLAAAAGSAATAQLGGAAVAAAANAATTTGQIVAGAASQVAQRGTAAAILELGSEATAARAAAQGVQGAERVLEMAKAGAIQQEARAAIAQSRAAVERAVEMLKKVVE